MSIPTCLKGEKRPSQQKTGNLGKLEELKF